MNQYGNYAVYYLQDPSNMEIFYVGCTTAPATRFEDHLKKWDNLPDKYRRIQNLLAVGVFPLMVIVEENSADQREALDKEQEVILLLQAKGEPLANKNLMLPSWEKASRTFYPPLKRIS
jgi:predicted GIY-YIG superfamily endonuclease